MSDDRTEKAKLGMRRWRAENPEISRARVKAWQKANPDKVKEKNRRCKARNPYRYFLSPAKARGLEITITKDDYNARVWTACHYCGALPGDAPLGMDRKDNAVGYTPENCVPCCWRCNRKKAADSDSEFIEYCRRVAARHPC